MTAVNSEMVSNFGRIRPFTLELLALESRKSPYPIDSDFIFEWMIFKLAGYKDSYKISGKIDFRPDRTIFFGVTCP